MGLREDVTNDTYERRVIRGAMLDAEANWLAEADRADSMTMRSVARTVADAFHNEAELYKTKETNFNDKLTESVVGRDSDDESAAVGEVPPAGEGR